MKKPAAPAGAITLEQYAGVTAALIEGLDLHLVLAQEKIDLQRWEVGSADWKARLVMGGPSSRLFTDFRRHLVRAEDALVRKVLPLDDDPTAWVSFLKQYSKNGRSDDFLRTLDLGPNDLSRLSRLWSNRSRKEESVRDALAASPAGQPPPLPAIQVSPRVLRRFPWSPPEPAEPAPSAAKPESPAEATGDAAAASMQVPSFMRPGERVGPMVPLAMPVATPAVAPVLAVAPNTTPPVAPAPLPAIAPNTTPPVAPAPSPAVAPQALPPAPGPLQSTAFGVVMPTQATLPFRSGEASPETVRAATPPESKAPRVPTGTAPVFKVPANLPLPFKKSGGEGKPAPGQKALSIEQHAAMSLEANVLPRHIESVLVRYGIDAATKADLDAYYRDLVAEDAEARSKWNRAYNDHYARWQSGHKH